MRAGVARSLGLAVALALSLCVVARPAWGHPDPHEAEPEVETWRRPVLWTALGMTAAGLMGTVYFHAKRNERTNEFNSLRSEPGAGGSSDGGCAVGLPNHGPHGCAQLYDSANRALTLSKISLGVAAASALTALTLKITEPEPTTTRSLPRNRDWSLACAPQAGAGVTCLVTF